MLEKFSFGEVRLLALVVPRKKEEREQSPSQAT